MERDRRAAPRGSAILSAASGPASRREHRGIFVFPLGFHRRSRHATDVAERLALNLQ